MTISQYKHKLISQLETVYESSEASIISDWALEFVLKISLTTLRVREERELTHEEESELDKISERLSGHEPIHYILGETEFFGLRIFVTNNVLIPRRETEELVEIIVKDAEKNEKENKNSIKILDLCTGSGCIAISLQKFINNAKTFAADNSEKALEVAEKNAKENKVIIQFLNTNVLDEYEMGKKINDEFDIIVSNPPYVTNSEKENMQKNVLEFEPHQALFVEDSDPLKFYKAIGNFAKKHLKINGRLYFEINENFGFEMYNLLNSMGFENIETLKDMQHKERFVRMVNDRKN